MRESTKKLTRLGLLTAAALVLGYVESLLPIAPGLPGVKIGLANTTLLYALYLLDDKSALWLMLAKVLLSGLLFAGASAMLYSLAGGALSLGVMAGLKRLGGMSVPGVSVAGGVAHNLGQLALACCVVGRGVLVYAPVLLLSGLGAGLATGFIALYLLRIVKRDKVGRDKKDTKDKNA